MLVAQLVERLLPVPRGPWFESSHRQNVYWTFTFNWIEIWKEGNERKNEAGHGPFFKKSSLLNRDQNPADYTRQKGRTQPNSNPSLLGTLPTPCPFRRRFRLFLIFLSKRCNILTTNKPTNQYQVPGSVAPTSLSWLSSFQNQWPIL